LKAGMITDTTVWRSALSRSIVSGRLGKAGGSVRPHG
jgi:hypothetical protein